MFETVLSTLVMNMCVFIKTAVTVKTQCYMSYLYTIIYIFICTTTATAYIFTSNTKSLKLDYNVNIFLLSAVK